MAAGSDGSHFRTIRFQVGSVFRLGALSCQEQFWVEEEDYANIEGFGPLCFYGVFLFWRSYHAVLDFISH
jgi:hypothetical protein